MKNRKGLASISILITGAILMSGCADTTATTESETTHTERVLDSGIPITTIDVSASETEEYIEETHYAISECEFDIDTDNHHISGCYDDGNYVVEYNLDYYDYGVDTVNNYSSSASSEIGQKHVSAGESWILVNTTLSSLLTLNDDTMGHNRTMVHNTLDSWTVTSIDENEQVAELAALLGEHYNLHSCVSRIEYDLSGILDSDCSLSDYGIRLSKDDMNFTSMTDTVTSNITKYTLRETLDGLPIGVQSDNDNDRNLPQYEDYIHYASYGDMVGHMPVHRDEYRPDFYSQENQIIVDMLNCKLTDFEVLQEGMPVMPLEQCISNSISGAIYEASRTGTNSAYVYGAELVYLPFISGEESIVYYGDSYLLFPYWAIYVTAEGRDRYTTEILINAVTGELVSHGM